MNILIVNDDSIHAPGIAVLAKAAAEFGDVWVVAPSQQCSAMSQRLTLDRDLHVEKTENFPVPVKAAYQVSGTPVDCVKVALDFLLEEKPDVVFSGMNNGYNVGFDIAYSGTLGAAFEAARNGLSAIAFSTASDSHLQAVEPHLIPVIRELLERKPEEGTVWNVNFPALKNRPLMGILRDRIAAPVNMYREKYEQVDDQDGVVSLRLVGSPTPTEELPEGTDAHAVRNGYISIGKVNFYN